MLKLCFQTLKMSRHTYAILRKASFKNQKLAVPGEWSMYKAAAGCTGVTWWILVVPAWHLCHLLVKWSQRNVQIGRQVRTSEPVWLLLVRTLEHTQPPLLVTPGPTEGATRSGLATKQAPRGACFVTTTTASTASGICSSPTLLPCDAPLRTTTQSRSAAHVLASLDWIQSRTNFAGRRGSFGSTRPDGKGWSTALNDISAGVVAHRARRIGKEECVHIWLHRHDIPGRSPNHRTSGTWLHVCLLWCGHVSQ